MSAALVVRTMEPHDASAWLNMQLVLWTDADRAEQTEQIASYFSGTNLFITVAFIALLGDSPTGFLELHLRPYAEGAVHSPVPHIEGWFVTATARRKGVGRALMAAAEDWALSHGFTEMTSDTTPAYPTSLPAHLKLGFHEVERLITFRKDLTVKPTE